MKKLLFLLLIPAIAFASVISFTVPTQRMDSTPLLYKDIAHYNVYCGDKTGNYVRKDTVASPATKITILTVDWSKLKSAINPGKNYCVLTTVDTNGRESVYSNEVVVNNNAAAAPKPPMIPAGTIINIVTTLP